MGFAPGEAAIQIGEWVADPADDSLSRGGERLKIEPRMMRLLLRLADSPGVVLSQDELLSSVWSGVVVGPASVYQSVSQLRKVLGDTDARPIYIETVARKGYRLIAPVIRLPPPSTAVAPAPGAAAPQPAPVAAAPVPVPRRRRWWTIGAAAVLAIGGATLLLARTPVRSIVVLPLADLTEDRSERPFCDGLTEEISNWLSQLPTLRVVARTSAFRFRDEAGDVRAIGRDLGVTHVLEGSLRRAGDVLRITVQLNEAGTGFRIWSDSFDVTAGDPLRVQEQIALGVAHALELQLTPEIDHRLAARRTANALANRRYYLALYHRGQVTAAGSERAIELFREAVAADGEFALAKIGLADALLNQRYFNTRRVEDIAAEAMPLLQEVEASSTLLPEFFIVRGLLYTDLRQREAGMRDMQRALELNPNSARANAALGFYQMTAARPVESLAYYDAAITLDPFNFNLYAYRCKLLADIARFEQAEQACARARALGPDTHLPYRESSAMEEARGNVREALRWNDASLRGDAVIVAVRAERARLLWKLDLQARAAAECDATYAAEPDAARGSFPLASICLRTALARGGAREMRELVAREGLAASTRANVLFELANAELAAGDAAAARAYVERALAVPSLTPEDLASPWQARTGRSYLLITAAALRATGDEAGARRRLAELSRLLAAVAANGVRTQGLYELEAQLAAQLGDPAGAMTKLRQAVALGWRGARAAELEPYFAALRGREDYRALLAEVRAHNAADAARLEAAAAPAGS